jgi:hypothetical protein
MPLRLGISAARQRLTDKWRRGRAVQGIPGGLHHWKDVPLDDIPFVPGMTLDDELKYFYWCASQHRPGHRVVELGPYVGRSTMALAAGVRRSRDPLGKVVSIDRFQWDDWMLGNTLGYTLDALSESQKASLPPEQLTPKANDSFLPLFHTFTKPLQDSIQVVNAPLQTFQWTGEPIDVLMVDAAKTWEAMDQIVQQFFSCLVEGAFLIHQDYKHAFTYWLHPVTERMIEHGWLTPADNIPGVCTHGFRFHKRWKEFKAGDYLRNAFTDDEADRLMARSVDRLNSEYDGIAVVAARCLLLRDQGRVEEARRVFEDAICAGGFADHWPMLALMKLAEEWCRLVTPQLDSLKRVGQHGVIISSNGQAELHTAGGHLLVMNLWSSRATRIRIQASEGSTSFHDEEVSLAPSSYQPVVIELNGRPNLTLRWEISGHIHCIAPMLLLAH